MTANIPEASVWPPQSKSLTGDPATESAAREQTSEPPATPLASRRPRMQELRHPSNIEGDEGLLESILSMQRP